MNKKPYIIPSKTNNKNMERYLHKKLSEVGKGGDGSGGKSPYIGENGNWFEWDNQQKKFVDTGTPAQGIEGKQGPQGIQGNTGSSVNYPYELVNNRTTNDATKGLSAAEGYRLGNDISQLTTTSDGVISEALAWVDERIKLLEARLTDEYNRIKVYAKDIHVEDIYQYEAPRVLECSIAGAPAAARVPDNWDLDTMGVWSGVPRFIGQEYVDKASKKVYKAVTLTNSTNDWVILN